MSANVLTRTVASYGSHPMRMFMRHGLRICLSAEYPLFTGSNLEEEYHLALKKMCLTPEDLSRIALNGFRSTFQAHSAARELRMQVHGEIRAAFDAYRGEG